MVYTRSNLEIEKISKSCQIVADTLIMLEEYIIEGTCVSDLDSMAEDYIRSQGARPAFKGYMGFPATLCVSIEEAVVHGIPKNKPLIEGQIIGKSPYLQPVFFSGASALIGKLVDVNIAGSESNSLSGNLCE